MYRFEFLKRGCLFSRFYLSFSGAFSHTDLSKHCVSGVALDRLHALPLSCCVPLVSASAGAKLASKEVDSAGVGFVFIGAFEKLELFEKQFHRTPRWPRGSASTHQTTIFSEMQLGAE